jgi:hypothetical protein
MRRQPKVRRDQPALWRFIRPLGHRRPPPLSFSPGLPLKNRSSCADVLLDALAEPFAVHDQFRPVKFSLGYHRQTGLDLRANRPRWNPEFT